MLREGWVGYVLKRHAFSQRLFGTALLREGWKAGKRTMRFFGSAPTKLLSVFVESVVLTANLPMTLAVCHSLPLGLVILLPP